MQQYYITHICIRDKNVGLIPRKIEKIPSKLFFFAEYWKILKNQ